MMFEREIKIERLIINSINNGVDYYAPFLEDEKLVVLKYRRKRFVENCI
jgi:hypothetical protein